MAIASASAAGRLGDVIAIGVAGGALVDGAISGADIVRPCGRCRQVINEAAQIGGHDIRVHCGSADGTAVATHLLSALLPDAFGPAALGIGTGR